MQRRSFLKTSSVALVGVGVGGIQTLHPENRGKDQINPTLSLNAYSFNKPLLNGEVSLEELFFGSIPGPDPYADIGQLIPYAITWQVKEYVMSGDGNVPTDFEKLIQIVTKYPYHGYFPLETLGEGNHQKKVKAIFQAVTKNFVQ